MGEGLPAVRCVIERNRNAIVSIAMLVLASTVWAACQGSPATTVTDGNVSRGAEIFATNCAACHGISGEGQPDWHLKNPDGTLPAPPLNGDGHTWHHADGLLYRIVSQGGTIFEDPDYPGFKSAMPAFGGQLTHDEIIAVLTYVKSLWEGKTKLGIAIRESQALVSEKDPFPPEGN